MLGFSQQAQPIEGSDLLADASTLLVPFVVSLINLVVPLIYSLFNKIEVFSNPRTQVYAVIMRFELTFPLSQYCRLLFDSLLLFITFFIVLL